MADDQPITSDENGFTLEPPPLSREEERKARAKERMRALRAANKANPERQEADRARAKLFYQANKERESAKRKERWKEYFEKNKEAIRAKDRVRNQIRRTEHPDQDKAYSKAYRERNPDRMLERHLKRKYNITLAQFQDLIRRSGNRCQCCRIPFSRLLRQRPNVDHCHATGKIRGILCNRCNVLLGHAFDNPKILRQCARYLERMAKEQESDPCNPPNSEPPSANPRSDLSDCG